MTGSRPGVYDLGAILAQGSPPPAGPTPALRIADGTGRWRQGVGAWLAAQESENTRDAYRREAAKWHAWCEQAGLDPFAVRRRHADVYARTLEGSNASRARGAGGPVLPVPATCWRPKRRTRTASRRTPSPRSNGRRSTRGTPRPSRWRRRRPTR